MYEKDFDPHYLTDIYIKELSKYLGLDMIKVNFKLYNPDGDLLLNWD